MNASSVRTYFCAQGHLHVEAGASGRAVDASRFPPWVRQFYVDGQSLPACPGHKYSPDQPRDEAGKWTDGGGSTATAESASISKEDVTYPEHAQAVARALWGREVPHHELAAMAGAQPGAKVTVKAEGQHLDVAVVHPGYQALRQFYRHGPDVVCQNHTIKVYDTGKGLGSKVFTDQVDALAKGGVSEIRASMKRDDKEGWNGYYTWPRLGYEGKIPDSVRGGTFAQLLGRGMPREFRKAETIQDLLRIPGGREWWKEHGTTAKGVFNLKEGSESRKALAGYLAGKKGSKSVDANPQKPGAGAEEIDLTAAEEAALDAYWDAQAKANAGRSGRAWRCREGHYHWAEFTANAWRETVYQEQEAPAWLKEVCRDELGRFASCGGSGSDPLGRDIGAGGVVMSHGEWRTERGRRLGAAHNAIRDVLRGPRPVPLDEVRRLHNHLAGLTVPQLREVRSQYGLRAPARIKEALKNQIASGLVFGGTTLPAVGKPAEEPAVGQKQEPAAAPARVPEGTFGRVGDITWGNNTSRQAALQGAKDLFGPHATEQDLLSASGLLKGASVRVARSSNGREVEVHFDGQHTYQEKDPVTGQMAQKTSDYYGKRTWTKEADGTVNVHNDIFRGKGAGLEMIARQVENATRLGVSYIDTHAAGNGAELKRDPKNAFSGFYAWPRFGYDSQVRRDQLSGAPAQLKTAVQEAGGSIRGLMATQEGRDWWKANGSSLPESKFDLTPGSYSQQTLVAYLKEQGKLH